MEAIANLVIALIDLLNAEIRSLRRSIVRLVLAIALLWVGSMLLLGGVAVLVYSLYLCFASTSLSPAGAAAITGAILAGASLFLGVIVCLVR